MMERRSPMVGGIVICIKLLTIAINNRTEGNERTWREGENSRISINYWCEWRDKIKSKKEVPALFIERSHFKAINLMQS